MSTKHDAPLYAVNPLALSPANPENPGMALRATGEPPFVGFTGFTGRYREGQ
jgi:hypothetical protein